jgi:hypothetical protein
MKINTNIYDLVAQRTVDITIDKDGRMHFMGEEYEKEETLVHDVARAAAVRRLVPSALGM